MGRYYSGDIEGKFWFAVQSSTAADRFGVTSMDSGYVNYYFDADTHLKGVQKELKKIEKTIGKDNMKKLDGFFNSVNGYNDKILEEHDCLEIFNEHKEDYADYFLGKKIEKCLIENGYCGFDAEL